MENPNNNLPELKSSLPQLPGRKIDTMALTYNRNQIKFRDMSENKKNDTLQELYRRLNAVALSLGIKEPLTAPEKSIIGNFIIDHYFDFSMNEVIYAFDCYAAGKLSYGQGENDKHFGTLNTPFIGNVLNSYREYRQNETRKDRELQESADRGKKFTTLTDEEKEAQQKEAYEMIVKHIERHNKLPIAAPWTDAFAYMDKHGIIEPRTDEQRKEWKEKVTRMIHAEARELHKNDLSIKSFVSQWLTPRALSYRIKAEYAKHYFTTCLELEDKEGENTNAANR